MRRLRSPQEKKALSLDKDRRNVYGQNDKASRKAIPRGKARVRRAYRRAVRQELHAALGDADLEGAERSEVLATAVPRQGWEKSPDRPLRVVVAHKLARRLAQTLPSESEEIVADLERRWRAEASGLLSAYDAVSGDAHRRERRILDPGQVHFSWGTASASDGLVVRRSGCVRAIHSSTGIVVTADYPSGVYSNRQLGRLRAALKLKLFAELQAKVARHLRVRSRPA